MDSPQKLSSSKILAATGIQQILNTNDEDKKTDERLHIASVCFRRCQYKKQKLPEKLHLTLGALIIMDANE
jgi:hypothetical protein